MKARKDAGEKPPDRLMFPEQPDFKAIFESAPGLFLVLDRDLRIVAVSRAYAKVTMTRPEDILGKGIFEVFPDNPDDPLADGVRNLHASLRRVLNERVPDAMAVQKYDIRRPESEGGGFEVRYWSPLNSPVLRPDGSLAYIIHRVEDVTEFVLLKQRGVERDRLTEDLREQAVRMEAEIYARSREVAEANTLLKQANEKITHLYEKTKELDRLKSRFFANVSHELRTPLTLILGPAGKLLDDPGLPESARHGLAMIQRNARQLYRLVSDLLDIAKLESGRMDIFYSDVDAASLTAVTAAHFESFAGDQGIDLAVEVPASLHAQLDTEKYQRLVLNLLSNALKFTPSGGKVLVSLAREGDRIMLRVEDSGPGVPRAMREAVFERFRQLEGGERGFGGTGLGLAIVREFAELHGGTATLGESSLGGASFAVSLPVAAPPGSPMHAAMLLDEALATHIKEDFQGPAAVAAEASGPEDTPLVLVVEDNPDMNAFLRNCLTGHFRVESAFDGKEGLEKARSLEPDLILSDIMMPFMSGDKMIRELRRDRKFEDVPVVLLTAKADDAVRLELLAEGVQDYIVKPFSAKEVVARAQSLVKDRRRHLAALQETRKRFQATFEQAAVGIAHVAADGRWLLVNRKLCDILGYGHEEMLATTFQAITHPDDLAADKVLLERFLAGELDAHSFEKRYLRKDGRPVWVLITANLVRDDRGRPEYFIVVVEDIQRRREAEEAVRRSLAEKETLIKEIHHRVKNNLQIITSLIALQFEEADQPEEAARAWQLESRIRSMALIHEQLYQSGNFLRIDMSGYINRLVRAIADSYGKEGAVSLRVAADPVELPIDSAVPCGLLLNELVTNSFKHAFAGGRTGSLDITLSAKDGRALLAVQDDGPGLPDLETFRRPGALGFELVRELTRQLKGTVRVVPGRGGRVEVEFPLAPGILADGHS